MNLQLEFLKLGTLMKKNLSLEVVTCQMSVIEQDTDLSTKEEFLNISQGKD